MQRPQNFDDCHIKNIGDSLKVKNYLNKTTKQKHTY